MRSKLEFCCNLLHSGTKGLPSSTVRSFVPYYTYRCEYLPGHQYECQQTGISIPQPSPYRQVRPFPWHDVYRSGREHRWLSENDTEQALVERAQRGYQSGPKGTVKNINILRTALQICCGFFFHDLEFTGNYGSDISLAHSCVLLAHWWRTLGLPGGALESLVYKIESRTLTSARLVRTI